MNPPERINKVLARLGYGSRRAIDKLILDQKVLVNGVAAILGQKVSPNDRITVNSKMVTQRPTTPIILAFNKPKGVTTTRKDRFAKVTVMDYLPGELKHLYPVGRLDKDSRGLLLFTNNGELAQKLTHPKFDHEKEYEVCVTSDKPLTQAALDTIINRLQSEIIDPNAQSKPFIIKQAGLDTKKNQATLTIILTEGKKRQIRSVMNTLGYTVVDLLRTRINTILLNGIKEGAYVTIDSKQLRL
jgi:pseudouridine synthase